MKAKIIGLLVAAMMLFGTAAISDDKDANQAGDKDKPSCDYIVKDLEKRMQLATKMMKQQPDVEDYRATIMHTECLSPNLAAFVIVMGLKVKSVDPETKKDVLTCIRRIQRLTVMGKKASDGTTLTKPVKVEDVEKPTAFPCK